MPKRSPLLSAFPLALLLSFGLLSGEAKSQCAWIYLDFGDDGTIENTCVEDTCVGKIVVYLGCDYPVDSLTFQLVFDCKKVMGHVTTGVYMKEWAFNEEIMCDGTAGVHRHIEISCTMPYGWFMLRYCPDFMSSPAAKLGHTIGTVRLYRDDLSLHNTVWFQGSVDGKPLNTAVGYVGSPTGVDPTTWGAVKAMYR